jgi:hypothetical protein
MPIFKVTATEDIKRTLVTYVVADDERAADQWASNASDKFWKCVWESPPWSAVSHIESVDDAPPGVIVRCATPA